MDEMNSTTVIIPTSDKRGERLAACLDKLPVEAQVVVLDHSDTPLEVQKVMKESGRKNLVWSAIEQWWGLARILNYGRKVADGKYLWFMPDDVEMIVNPTIPVEQPQICGLRLNLQEILRFNSHKLHSCGLTIINGVPTLVGYGMPLAGITHPSQNPVLGVSSVGMLLSAEVFDELEGFDDDLFFGFEDIDLCLRARERGISSVVSGVADYWGSGFKYVKPQSPRGVMEIAPSALVFARKWVDSGRLMKLVDGEEVDANRHAYGS